MGTVLPETFPLHLAPLPGQRSARPASRPQYPMKLPWKPSSFVGISPPTTRCWRALTAGLFSAPLCSQVRAALSVKLLGPAFTKPEVLTWLNAAVWPCLLPPSLDLFSSPWLLPSVSRHPWAFAHVFSLEMLFPNFCLLNLC